MVVFPYYALGWKHLFSCKLGPKYQNCQFQLKFGTQAKSNMQNSVVICTFSVFDWKYPFWVNFAKKMLKFVTQTNSNTYNSVITLTFSVLDDQVLQLNQKFNQLESENSIVKQANSLLLKRLWLIWKDSAGQTPRILEKWCEFLTVYRITNWKTKC